MNETLDYLRVFTHFPFALRRFRKQKMTLPQAQQIVRDDMARREENFLRMIESSVYAYPHSPYLPLLERAGCELGDLRATVEQKGVEATLRQMRAEGIYVTFEEFKGRKPIVRGSLTLPVTAHDFDNPSARRDFTLETGGSTGAGVNVGVDLDYIAARAPHELVGLAAHGMLDAPEIRWSPILPGGTLRSLLRAQYIRHMPSRWFSPIGWHDSTHWLKYGIATYYVLCWMRLAGMPVPFPEYVTPDRAVVLARAAAELVRTHGKCVIRANVSSALRIVLAAREAQLDLRGTMFTGGAEPTTPGKIEQIEKGGVRYIPNYGMVEASRVAVGCANPGEVGDVHLLQDGFVLFTHPYHVENFDVTVPAFNLTALLPAAPKVMLNLQMDDYGIVQERHCGCELESYGYTTHLCGIRSYSKLTGEGITLISNEVVRILEEVLPALFGGTPLDYQLMEQEDEEGFTRLFLVISPRVELADEQAVVRVMLDALHNSSAMADAARTVLRRSDTLRIKRIEPIMTRRGKLMPLHIERRM